MKSGGPGVAGYGTGRRKCAVARVWLFEKEGDLSVNGQTPREYFDRDVLDILARSPLTAMDYEGKYHIKALVRGGGKSGQAGAVKLGVARALVAMDPELRAELRAGGFMTRDPRVKERKKYGRKKARRGFQFVKR